MRIALVVHDYHRQGGHSRYCAELAERFGRFGHEVHVFANRFPPDAPLYPQSAGAGVYFRPVPAFRRSALGTVLSFFLPASWLIARSGPFDIVHAQGFCTLGANILTAHICCAAWHAQRVRSGHPFDWKERIFDATVTRLETWLYSRPKLPAIAISRRVQRDLEQYYRRTAPTFIVPHGVDTAEFDLYSKPLWRARKRAELGLDEHFAVLWVGDLRKGFQAAMEAVAACPGQHLLAVSRNDPKVFQAAAKKLGVSDRVHFLPPTQRIAEFYAAADVFLFPTTYDAFGMVVLEAMAMGLPVIVSRDAGAAELIEHTEDGILLNDPLDAKEAAEWLRRLESDKSRARSLGEKAAHKAQSQNWDRVAERTMSLYLEVLYSGRTGKAI